MRIFIDTVETIAPNSNLDSSLISIGAVAENGDTFYGEFTDYNEEGVSSFVLKILREHLPLSDIYERALTNYFDPKYPEVRGNTPYVIVHLVNWLNSFGSIEMWVDYQLHPVLHSRLKGKSGFLFRCENMPFSLYSALKVKGYDPEVNRETFAGMDSEDTYRAYNALHLAQTLKGCYDVLFAEKPEKPEKPENRLER